MAGSLSDYAEDQVIRWLFTALAVTRPAAWYAALHSAPPGEQGLNGEMNYDGYLRQAVAFGAPASGKIANSASITFPSAPSGTFGTDVYGAHWSVWTALNGGNCLGWGTRKQDFLGLQYTFAAGTLICSARGLTTFAKNLVLNWLFRNVAVTRPGAWWMAVHTQPPNDLGVGGEQKTLGGARRSLVLVPSSNGVLVNSNQIDFGPATSKWPSLSYYSIWDAASAGNCLFVKALKAPYGVAAAQTLRFAAGQVHASAN